MWAVAVDTGVTNMKKRDEVTQEPCRIQGEFRKSSFKEWPGEEDPENEIRTKYYQSMDFFFPSPTVSKATERYKKTKS